MSASEVRLYFLLQKAAHSLKKAADHRLKHAAQITTAQAAVLAVVKSHGTLSQRQLAETLKQRESAMTMMVERLLKAGYIQRARSLTDARAWALSLTPLGFSALEAVEQPFGEINSILDEAFSRSDAIALAAGLQTILRQLDNGIEDA